ncbi:MAG: transporter substrate-binding domain-containing protein [Pseudomonadota bacterium]
MRFLGIFAAVFLLSAPCFAAELSRLDQIVEKGVLRVGTTGDYPPFTMSDKATGQFSGFHIDLVQSLATSLGVKIEYVQTSWPNLMKDIEADMFDIAIGGISITLERQKKAFFTVPYSRDGKAPVARCADKDKFDSLEKMDQPGVRAIVNPGGTNEKFTKTNLKQATVTVFPDNTKIFEEIIAGRADVMITDGIETRYQQKIHPGVLCATRPGQYFDFYEKAYLLPRDMIWKNYVDQWLHIQIENGTVKALYAKWVD